MNVTPSECNAAFGFLVSICSWVSGHFNIIDNALSLLGLLLGLVLGIASLYFQIRRDIRDKQKSKREKELHDLKMREYEQ